MNYDQLYTLLRIITGLKDEQLDRIPLEDLEQAKDMAVKSAAKWLNLRGFDGSERIDRIDRGDRAKD
jgi:hypothetical protein